MKGTFLLLPASVLFSLCVSGSLSPYTLIRDGESAGSPTGVTYVEHDANEVRLGLVSDGGVALDRETGGWKNAWPRWTDNRYVFAGGLWITGVADVDDDGDRDYLGLQLYDPLSGRSECAPGRIGDEPEDPLSRLYVSSDPGDLAGWPDEFRDGEGNPVVRSLQDIVGFYNDVSGSPLHSGGPYGIEIKHRSMAFLVGRTEPGQSSSSGM